MGNTNACDANGVITIRCTRSRGPRGFFCLQDVRRGPVNVDVIQLQNADAKVVAFNSVFAGLHCFFCCFNGMADRK